MTVAADKRINATLIIIMYVNNDIKETNPIFSPLQVKNNPRDKVQFVEEEIQYMERSSQCTLFQLLSLCLPYNNFIQLVQTTHGRRNHGRLIGVYPPHYTSCTCLMTISWSQ
jgi:hypothetical protein